MPPSPPPQLVEACQTIAEQIRSSGPYAHTSHLAVQVGGIVLHDEHFRGPERADVFSVTKTVLATLVGVAQLDGLMPPLDDAVSQVLPVLRCSHAEGHTWRQLLTMTRGSVVDGPWEVDEITALPGGQVAHIAAAPQQTPSGSTFRYDNGAAHLLSAGLQAVVGDVSDYARRRLFDALHIDGRQWLADPDGVPFGYGHLFLRAEELLRLGTLWLAGGEWRGRALVDPAFVAQMTTAQSQGGPPEETAYGYLTWVGSQSFFAGGWAGQHVLVLPAAQAVVVTTGDPRFSFGPPPTDQLPEDWRPAVELVRRHLVPLLAATEHRLSPAPDTLSGPTSTSD